MYKVGIVGHFGFGANFIDGQTIKTKILTNELKSYLGSDALTCLDTYKWKFRLIIILLKCFFMMIKCKNIIILPGSKGIRLIIPLINLYNVFTKKRLHYVVIGGWLPHFLEQKKKYIVKLQKYKGIYVETLGMKQKLELLGLQNVYHLPNFKALKIVDKEEINYYKKPPYKLCTCSRVTREKGIEIAIEAVKAVNLERNNVVYTLDIYGPIDEKYKRDFDYLMKNSPNYISYKGSIDYDKTVEVLKHYFLLLFPTFYPGEGFPGTIIDAFASGLPVIANDWKYNKELVEDYRNGFLYIGGVKGLVKILKDILNNIEIINKMKDNCINDVEKYKPENVIQVLLNNLS